MSAAPFWILTTLLLLGLLVSCIKWGTDRERHAAADDPESAARERLRDGGVPVPLNDQAVAAVSPHASWLVNEYNVGERDPSTGAVAPRDGSTTVRRFGSWTDASAYAVHRVGVLEDEHGYEFGPFDGAAPLSWRAVGSYSPFLTRVVTVTRADMLSAGARGDYEWLTVG